MKKFLMIPMFISLIAFTGTFSLQGCTKNEVYPVQNDTMVPTPPLTNNGKSYLALGDSYTIGQGVASEFRFPAQTVALLRQAGFNIKDPQYIAATGWTTQNLLNAINQQNPVGPFDIVTLLIGVNDQYQQLDTAGYRLRFTQLLNKSIELTGNRPTRVIVLSIPDYSVTPFVNPSSKAGVRKAIDEFNFINKQVTFQNNIRYVDITPSTREAETNPSLIAGDGLHPSGKEYKKWADSLLPITRQVLQ